MIPSFIDPQEMEKIMSMSRDKQISEDYARFAISMQRLENGFAKMENNVRSAAEMPQPQLGLEFAKASAPVTTECYADIMRSAIDRPEVYGHLLKIANEFLIAGITEIVNNHYKMQERVA